MIPAHPAEPMHAPMHPTTSPQHAIAAGSLRVGMKLQHGDWQALICPEQGSAFAAFHCRGQDVLVPTPVGARHPGAYGAFWMLPWANRLDGGCIAGHAMPINRAAEGTAIHGLADFSMVMHDERLLPLVSQADGPKEMRRLFHDYVSAGLKGNTRL